MILWNHKFYLKKLNSLSLERPLHLPDCNYSNNGCNNLCNIVKYEWCAICRGILCDFCVYCSNNDLDSTIKTQHLDDQSRTKNVLFTLLCMQKRNDCVFFTVDKHILFKIYQHWIKSEIRNSLSHSCTVDKLLCGHVFHSHCLSFWCSKRDVCPLDNSSKTIPQNIFSIDMLRLCNVYVCIQN